MAQYIYIYFFKNSIFFEIGLCHSWLDWNGFLEFLCESAGTFIWWMLPCDHFAGVAPSHRPPSVLLLAPPTRLVDPASSLPPGDPAPSRCREVAPTNVVAHSQSDRWLNKTGLEIDHLCSLFCVVFLSFPFFIFFSFTFPFIVWFSPECTRMSVMMLASTTSIDAQLRHLAGAEALRSWFFDRGCCYCCCRRGCWQWTVEKWWVYCGRWAYCVRNAGAVMRRRRRRHRPRAWRRRIAWPRSADPGIDGFAVSAVLLSIWRPYWRKFLFFSLLFHSVPFFRDSLPFIFLNFHSFFVVVVVVVWFVVAVRIRFEFVQAPSRFIKARGTCPDNS